MTLVMKSEPFVEYKTEDAAKEIVGCRRPPITYPKKIVEHKHNGHAKESVDDPHQHKPCQRII